MKIRIKDNSLRYRLTKSEVKKLCESGYLEAITQFNTSTLCYAIKVIEGIEFLNADFVENKITLLFPQKEANVWNQSDRITYENSVELQNGNSLKLLLEKDFICLDHTHEDQSDNYENPNKTC